MAAMICSRSRWLLYCIPSSSGQRPILLVHPERLASSVYSRSRDFPKENSEAHDKQISWSQSGSKKNRPVLLMHQQTKKKPKFRPLDDIKTEILQNWRPEYIADENGHLRNSDSELPALVSECDLNDVMQERAENHMRQFANIQQYTEYMQPMLIAEAFAQAQSKFAERLRSNEEDTEVNMRLQIRKATVNKKQTFVQMKIQCVTTLSDVDWKRINDGMASGDKLSKECLFSVTGFRFTDADNSLTAISDKWDVKTVYDHMRGGRTQWDMNPTSLPTGTAALRGKVLEVELLFRIFDTDQMSRLANDDPGVMPQPGDVISINFIANLRQLIRQTTALRHLFRSPLLAALLDPGAHEHVFALPSVSSSQTPVFDARHLNQSQLDVIQQVSDDIALNPDKARVSLVHGPPGTGKSHTILRLIETLVQAKQNVLISGRSKRSKASKLAEKQKRPILLCAPSNNAVDNVLLAIIKHNAQIGNASARIQLARFGRQDSVHPDILPYFVNDYGELIETSQDATLTVKKRPKMSQLDVIGVTIDSSVRTVMDPLRNCGVLCVIVDEACQATEIDIMSTLRFKCAKLVMFGDPLQLQPTILSPAFLLDTQYRMTPEIAQFPSNHVYQGRLKTGTSPSPSLSTSPYPFKSYLVFNVLPSREQQGRINARSFSNVHEANMLCALCEHIVNRSPYFGHQIGVITFYADQVSLLRRMMYAKSVNNRQLSSIEVNSVDGFQGREKDIIILSCVRSHTLGFVSDLKRMNVAITRAKHGLYIMGNVPALRKAASSWRALIDDARKRNLIANVQVPADIGRHLTSNNDRERVLNIAMK